MSQPYRVGWLNGKCVLVWRDASGKRKRYSLGTTDPREAQRRAPAVYVELTRPLGKTVADLWEAYVADRQGRAILATMQHTWKALSHRFGPMEGDRITIADCRAHVEERRKANIKDGTLVTELGHLRTVLRWAEKQGLIDRAPYIERPSAPKPKERHLSRDQVRALIQACDLPHLKLFVHLAYATAGRSSALLGLTWDRCDFERGKINLEDPAIDHPHKGRAIVPMTDGLRIALTEARRGALTEFVIEWAGKRVASVKRGIKAAGLRAEVGKVTPHTLRHSAAVCMAEDGVPMEEIAQYLGHSNVNVTRRVYARFSPDYLRNAARALELDDLGPLRPKGHYVRKSRSADSIDEIMVGATGIEPVTPTMSR
jgi:integrase